MGHPGEGNGAEAEGLLRVASSPGLCTAACPLTVPVPGQPLLRLHPAPLTAAKLLGPFVSRDLLPVC